MASEQRRQRVHLSGDREGAYVVAEERPDGSLVLIPDSSPQARRPQASRPAEQLGSLAQLLTRRSEPVRTTHEALDAWGVQLRDSEFVVEFAMADANERHGFVALTNERLIILARGRTGLQPRQELALSSLQSVDSVGRGRKRKLLLEFAGVAPIVIDCPDRAQLDRLEAGLRTT
jgi:hypothetical protein